MAERRSTIEFRVDGLSIAALTAGTATDTRADTQAGTRAGPGNGRGRPLIAALHGGTYTALRQLAFAEECQLWAGQQS